SASGPPRHSATSPVIIPTNASTTKAASRRTSGARLVVIVVAIFTRSVVVEVGGGEAGRAVTDLRVAELRAEVGRVADGAEREHERAEDDGTRHRPTPEHEQPAEREEPERTHAVPGELAGLLVDLDLHLRDAYDVLDAVLGPVPGCSLHVGPGPARA